MKMPSEQFIVTGARILAAVLVAAGCVFYWKFDIGNEAETQTAAFMFGFLPILYGVLIAVKSLLHHGEKRVQNLTRLIGIPLLFIGASLAAALVVWAFK